RFLLDYVCSTATNPVQKGLEPEACGLCLPSPSAEAGARLYFLCRFTPHLHSVTLEQSGADSALIPREILHVGRKQTLTACVLVLVARPRSGLPAGRLDRASQGRARTSAQSAGRLGHSAAGRLPEQPGIRITHSVHADGRRRPLH